MAKFERVNLGDRVKDRITGLEGLVIAITEWLYGCRRLIIQPEKVQEGKVLDTYTIDEPQATVVQRAVIEPIAPAKPEERTHGAGRPEPEHRATPSRH